MSDGQFQHFAMPAMVSSTPSGFNVIDNCGYVICTVPFKDQDAQDTAHQICALINVAGS